jgi:RNA polymerase sigma-70 factor (ECF subfamily)
LNLFQLICDILNERSFRENRGDGANGFSDAGAIDKEQRRKIWMQKTAQGHVDSFEKLYHDLIDDLYGYLRLRLADDELIKDILQEVFLAVWKNASQYTGHASVSAWVIGIAKHKMMDKLRRKYQTSELALAEEDLDFISKDFTDQIIEKVSLDEAIDSLEPMYKELAYLVFVQELSYKEVSQCLDIPEGTVKSRVYHLKKKLQKQLQEKSVQYE